MLRVARRIRPPCPLSPRPLFEPLRRLLFLALVVTPRSSRVNLLVDYQSSSQSCIQL
jgi:hypothetical protein